MRQMGAKEMRQKGGRILAFLLAFAVTAASLPGIPAKAAEFPEEETVFAGADVGTGEGRESKTEPGTMGEPSEEAVSGEAKKPETAGAASDTEPE